MSSLPTCPISARPISAILPPTILHLDLNAFYCSVEETRDPALLGKAFAVGGAAEGRRAVSSRSSEARRFGAAVSICVFGSGKLSAGALPAGVPAYEYSGGSAERRRQHGPAAAGRCTPTADGPDSASQQEEGGVEEDEIDDNVRQQKS